MKTNDFLEKLAEIRIHEAVKMGYGELQEKDCVYPKLLQLEVSQVATMIINAESEVLDIKIAEFVARAKM